MSHSNKFDTMGGNGLTIWSNQFQVSISSKSSEQSMSVKLFFFSLCVRTITFQWKFVVVIVKVSQSTAKEVLVPLWTIRKVLNSIADHLIVGWLILHLCVSVCLFCRFWFDHRRKGYDLCLDLKWSVRLIEVIDLWGKGFTVMDS